MAREPEAATADGGREPAHYRDLTAVRAEAFRMLACGAADRRSACHHPALVTVALDGAPTARTVVLRAFDAEARRLTVHTDRRSAKVAELAAEPRCTLHFYDVPATIQMRCAGIAAVHVGDDVARARWAVMSAASRRIYQVSPEPGTPQDEPTDGFDGREPLPEDAAFGNFAVIRLTMASLEWLYLSAAGHRRARLTWSESGERAIWLVP